MFWRCWCDVNLKMTVNIILTGPAFIAQPIGQPRSTFDFSETETIETIFDNFKNTLLETCDIWDTNYSSDNWEPEFMTIFGTWQLIVTLDSICNSCITDIFRDSGFWTLPFWLLTNVNFLANDIKWRAVGLHFLFVLKSWWIGVESVLA